jgi:hypothetical protein
MSTHRIEFLTPLFSRGAYDDLPEIRPASIRGQLHWWFRLLGGKYDDEKSIFGGVHGGATASKLVVRVSDLPINGASAAWLPTLPHKPGGQNPRNAPNAPRCAMPPGTAFTMTVLERLGGLTEVHRKLVDRTIETWLLAGSLGLRATRGGGSFHWDGARADEAGFRAKLSELLQGAPLRFDLLGRIFTKAEDARKVATETIAHQAFEDIYYPLGAVRQGNNDNAPGRKTSPLRLTVRRFSDGYRILAVWDDRRTVTGNTSNHLREAIERLANGTAHSRPTELGRLLQQSSLACSTTP